MYNPFELLGVDESYDIDLVKLEANYHNLMLQYHPDRLINEESEEKLVKLTKSTQINDSYNNLKDPLKRAIALLEVKTGVNLDVERFSLNDPKFIMEQFKYREQVDNLKHNFDFDKYNELNDYCQNQSKQVFLQLAQSFQEQDYQRAKTLIQQLFFLRKLANELDSLEG